MDDGAGNDAWHCPPDLSHGRSRLVNLIGIAIGVAGVAFVVTRIVRDREAIADALSSAELGWLVVGGAAGMIAMALIGVNWLLILRHAGAAAPWRRGMAWFFVGQLGKYVPGGIWPIVGQAELAHRGSHPTRRRVLLDGDVDGDDVPRGGRRCGDQRAAGTRPTLEQCRWQSPRRCCCCSSCSASPSARRAIDRLAHRVTTRELRLPEPRWFALVVVRHLPVWLAFAGMNVFAVVALGVDVDASLVVELIFVTCVSWMAGFVVVGVPGGIGVRETIFISMTTAALGPGVAVSAAVLSRVVSIAVDLLGAAGIGVDRPDGTSDAAADRRTS